ncbi:MAG: YjcZ family sporulation protein [Bacilli bacterium]|nr:YjcZ family sporulation protein [Bacilli bacterium]
MYYYGGNNYGCSNMSYGAPLYPVYTYGNNNSTYSIILVLFILLVIVIGTRYTN